MNKRKSQNSPPTPERIAELKARAESQFAYDLVKLINASGIEDPRVVTITLCQVLIQFIMAKDGELTFREAGKTAIAILKIVIKRTRYGVGPKNEVIDVKTGEEISPGGLKQ